MDWLLKPFGKPLSRGSITMLTVIGGVFILGLTAMVTDVGWMYYNQARLNSAVNAGWKAGFDRMMQLGLPLDDVKKAEVKLRVIEVCMQNGYTAADVSNIVVNFPNSRAVEVLDTRAVNLFFARIMNFNSATVAANRGNIGGSYGGEGVVPLAVPFGVVKDLDRNTYSLDFFDMDDPNSGFATNSEYILKLGSGRTNQPPATSSVNPNFRGILIPMEAGAQTEDTYVKAYGIVLWSLPRDANDVGSINQVDWLCGYRGGAFLLECGDYTTPDGQAAYDGIRAKLISEGFVENTNFIPVFGSEAIGTILTAVGNNMVALVKRPKLAVYSNSPSPDAVEEVIRAAKIPYGTYNPTRGEAYNAAANTRLYDGELLSDALNAYHWLHMDHDDFTGMSGGCQYVGKSCYDWDNYVASMAFDWGPDGIPGNGNDTTDLCTYCNTFFQAEPIPGWGVTYNPTSCWRQNETIDSCRQWDNQVASLTKTNKNNTNLCSYCAGYYFDQNKNNWTTNRSFNYEFWKCEFHDKHFTCQHWDTLYPIVKISSVSTQLDPYCRDFYFYGGSNMWTSPKKKVGYLVTSCSNYGRRCTNKGTHDNRYWANIAHYPPSFCGNNDRPQCKGVANDAAFAAARGYTDAAGYNRNAKYTDAGGNVVTADGAVRLAPDSPHILNPTKTQKMKWDVARKIYGHVIAGGHIYGQCWSPETLDMALWQRKIWTENRTGNSATHATAYSECLAFDGFVNAGFPRAEGNVYYSTINSQLFGPFTTTDVTEPRCQNHTGANPDSGSGLCDAFSSSALKPLNQGVSPLGYLVSSGNAVNYLYGVQGLGRLSHMGGHYLTNIQTKRLVLNNVLYACLSEKPLLGATAATSGKQKANYGVVDPDNVVAGGANDYRDRFMFGFTGPLQINDRLITESGNMAGPSDQSVDFRVYGSADYPPASRIIVPITDIPPEVASSTKNALASAVYDITGVDHADGVYTPDQYNFAAAVRIIGFAEFEIIPPASYTRDGSNITEGDTGSIGNYQSGQVRGRFIRYIVRPGEIPLE